MADFEGQKGSKRKGTRDGRSRRNTGTRWGTSLLERPKHSRAVRVRESTESWGVDVATPRGRSTKTGKKHLTLVKRDAAGSPRSRASPSILLPPVAPRLSDLFRCYSLYRSRPHDIALSFSLRLSLGETFIGSSLCRRSLQHRRQERRGRSEMQSSIYFSP